MNDRPLNDPPVLETTGGAAGWRVSGHQLSAFRSLARSRNVDLGYVLEKASEGKLRDVVALRARKTLSPGRPGMGAKDGWQALTVLSFKREPPSR